MLAILLYLLLSDIDLFLTFSFHGISSDHNSMPPCDSSVQHQLSLISTSYANSFERHPWVIVRP